VIAVAAALLVAASLTPVDEAGYAKVIASKKGSVVLADFWATWCVPCRKELPALTALAEKYKAKGVVLVTVSGDEPEDEAGAAALLDKLKAPMPRYVKRAKDDDAFIRKIDPKWSGALPALFLYDRSGKKAVSFTGETPIGQIEAALQKLL